MSTVRLGSLGQDVVLVQQRINHHGFGPLSEDGDFGKKTESAVVQFQMAQGLRGDGVVGPLTWGELLDDYAEAVGGRAEIALMVREKELGGLVASAGSGADIGAVLSFAVEDLGKREHPSGSNAGPHISHLVDGYHDYWKLDKSKYPALPWCAMAVSRWIYHGLGLSSWKEHPFGHFFGGVGQIEDWSKEHGKFFTPEEDGLPPVGAIFLMSRSSSGSDPSRSARSGHTGLILSVEDDQIVTIEGNVKNSVTSMNRNLSVLTGYVIWWE